MTDRRIFRKLIDAMRLQRGRLDQQARNIDALRRDLTALQAGGTAVRESDYDPERLRSRLRPKEVK